VHNVFLELLFIVLNFLFLCDWSLCYVLTITNFVFIELYFFVLHLLIIILCSIITNHMVIDFLLYLLILPQHGVRILFIAGLVKKNVNH